VHGGRRRGSDAALATSGHVGHGSPRYELLGLMGKPREDRKGSERAPVVVGHGELQLQRASVMAAKRLTALLASECWCDGDAGSQ